MPSISENLLRYFLIAFNVIIGILGVVGTALAALIAFKSDIFLKGLSDITPEEIVDQLSNKTLKYSACVLFVVSLIIVLISILGCCGASDGNRFMLCAYATIMFILMILNLTFLCLLTATRAKLQEGIDTGLWMALNETKNNVELRKIVQDIFVDNECCGVDSPKDLEGYDHLSCYTLEGEVVGCKEKLEKSINRNFVAIRVISIFTAIFQFMLVVASCFLCVSSKTGNQDETYAA